MKKTAFICFLAGLLLLTACAADQPEAPNAQIANPWKSYDTLAEAQTALQLTFPIPETVAGSYAAESFRVMNGELLEVIYRDGDMEVIVRMQSGEGQDLSGVYETFESTETMEVNGTSVTVKHTAEGCLMLLSRDGASWSLYAPTGFAGDSARDFLNAICSQ